MAPDSPEEKARPDRGERQGIVIEVTSDFIRVELYTLKGWRRYKFPKHFSKDVLQKDDSVKCYIVEIAGKLEPRLGKIPEKVFTKEEEGEIKRKFAEIAEKGMKELEEIMRRLENKDR